MLCTSKIARALIRISYKTCRSVNRGFPLPYSDLVDVARRDKDDCLRDGTAEMFSDLSERNVPILVFSAGLGDSVCAVLEETNIKHANVKVYILSSFLASSTHHFGLWFR